MSDLSSLPILPQSVVEYEGTTYALMNLEGERMLVVAGQTAGFVGTPHDQPSALLCSLLAENADTLRQRLPWLQPVTLGLRTSAGMGDRLGFATPGHIQAIQGTGVAPIFAQQSVRENTRTGRTPQQVLDDAMWGAFEMGWREAWGADADHLKTLADIDPFVEAGYTFYTIDPGDYVDDDADTAPLERLREKVSALPWDELETTMQDTQVRYLTTVDLDGRPLPFDAQALYSAVAKYGAAIAHTARMARRLRELMGTRPFELEMSVDETGTTTRLQEHFYIVSELKRLGVPLVSMAPRFVGRFEKGVDYIGSLDELQRNLAGHAAIMRHFGNSYKLSLHTGSDKFDVYPPAMRYTQGLVHLKTAGTSYLEALRLLATVETDLFREILTFARERYEEDRKTYHVSASLDKVPASDELTDEQLPSLLEQFDARQVLHVTFGSALDRFGAALERALVRHREEYYAFIKRHFVRHLEPLRLQ
ncbi:tagaturonate epimerase family protein [Ktedonospora formicarum]|uniref:Tagaturonate/fructuronate epimerase n=1 Tax=Ktedonospora formicarum TaxID=2778364 RepID=A0A8J3HXX0_9CHLR|nr:tagaturonate epimerase family protein [Ktedonospora formicarum]GHO46217.1 hypothetical protein KSX_43800 [Ktedonospora formicarum]